MQLTYSGPKPYISSHGISFDNNKEDKFIYLGIIADLILALNHDYIENKCYGYDIHTKKLDSAEVLSLIRNCDPMLDSTLQDAKRSAELKINEEIQRTHNNPTLCDENKEVLLKNIELMHDYETNRSINKAVYYSGLNALAKIIKTNNINTITSSEIPAFTHVLQSLQGALRKLHPPLESTVEIHEHDGQLTTTLTVATA